MPIRHRPKIRLFNGSSRNSLFLIFQPALSKRRFTIKVSMPVFRKGSKLTRELQINPTISAIVILNPSFSAMNKVFYSSFSVVSRFPITTVFLDKSLLLKLLRPVNLSVLIDLLKHHIPKESDK
jgi:hypothetical protein